MDPVTKILGKKIKKDKNGKDSTMQTNPVLYDTRGVLQQKTDYARTKI